MERIRYSNKKDAVHPKILPIEARVNATPTVHSLIQVMLWLEVAVMASSFWGLVVAVLDPIRRNAREAGKKIFQVTSKTGWEDGMNPRLDKVAAVKSVIINPLLLLVRCRIFSRSKLEYNPTEDGNSK
jgi:hypothetical protein